MEKISPRTQRKQELLIQKPFGAHKAIQIIMFTVGNEENKVQHILYFTVIFIISFLEMTDKQLFLQHTWWSSSEIVKAALQAKTNDMIINHTRKVLSTYKTHTSALLHITDMGFKRWRNASIINQTGRKRPQKREREGGGGGRKGQTFPCWFCLLQEWRIKLWCQLHSAALLLCSMHINMAPV